MDRRRILISNTIQLVIPKSAQKVTFFMEIYHLKLCLTLARAPYSPVYANAIAGWSFGIRAAFTRMKSPAPEGLTKFAIIVFLTELLLMLNGLSPSHSSLLFPPSVRASLLGRLRSYFFYFAALASLLSIVYPRVPGQGYDEVSMAKQQTSTDLFFR